MTDVSNLKFTLELSQIIVMVTSFVLSFLLWFIKVPSTEYSRKLVKTKNSIAVCFFVCSILLSMCIRNSHLGNYETFSTLMMLVVTAMSSVVLSFSLMNLLEERDNDKFYLNLAAVILMSWVLMRVYLSGDRTMTIVALLTYIVLFIIQCIIHIIHFNRAYVKSVSKVEQYYDEEEDHKIRWIRFCYIIMMLTQMFILVYLILPHNLIKIYALWYVLFLVYFTANFISFLGSHKLLLDAFAYRALTFQDMKDRREQKKLEKARLENMPENMRDAEFKRLEKALTRWVDEKRYRDYDRSRDQIAADLNTSKELLHLYFVSVLKVDFKTWRTTHRIEDAKNLLLEKRELSIHLVGEMAGFSDRSNFHRQFTRIVGCSPRQWRESSGNLK